MPTISGLRRRGYTPEAIRDFCDRIGVAKSNSTVDIAMLEHCIREDLNARAARAMVVLRPLKLVIENYPEGQVEQLVAENNPEDPAMGNRTIPFGREIYIEQDDFMEVPVKKFFRLAPGQEVRLKHAYIIKCEAVVKDDAGNIVEIRCSYDPETKSGGANSGRKVKGTLHWVCAAQAIKAEVRLYDYLLTDDSEEETEDFIATLNPNSLEVITTCFAEPSLAEAKLGNRYQFLRQGYFCVDPDTQPDNLVFNRVVGLRDSWAKAQKG
jgi:glutaminyl-tRNA synthetase